MRKGTDRSPSLPFLYHNPRARRKMLFHTRYGADPLAAGCYAFF